MIRPRFPSSLLARTAACLALACVLHGRLRAEEMKHEKPEAPKTPAATTHAPTLATPAADATPTPPAKLAPHAAETPGEVATAAPASAATAAPAEESNAKAKAPAAISKRAPDEVHGLLNLGVSLTDRGDYAAAEIAYRQALNSPEIQTHELKTALLGLARMHRRKGELAKAAAIYERFLKDYPGDERTPDALLELGRTHRDLGVYKLAIARFYSVINSTLKLPSEGFEHYQVLAKTAQFEIAETHFLAGEFAEANKFYTRLRLLDLAPADRARAHFKAGYALRLQGDLDGAASTLRAYITQWPDDENIPEARYLLAVTLRELKRPQEAFAATLELLRTEKSRVATDPKRWSYWQRRTGNQLANDFFEAGDTLNAHAIYAGLLELGTDHAWRLPITYQLGLCYERLGINDRARASYQTIVEAAGATPPADLAELARMAAWRIDHLEWREKVGQQITKFFDTTTGKTPVAPRLPSTRTTAAATP